MASTRASFISTALFAVAGAMAAFATACVSVTRTCYSFLHDFVTSVPAKFKEAKLVAPLPAVQLVQACAHAARQAKRERPVSFGTWRMCPSA